MGSQMTTDKTKYNMLGDLVKDKVKESLQHNNLLPTKPKDKKTRTKKELKKVITEALVVTPEAFVLNTEKLSKTTKEGHETLYKKCVDSFNKTSSELDAVNKQESNSYRSQYRSLKLDECRNLNSIKLHELYFNNISDLASNISIDSLPYIRLTRDFGTFEIWQYDFMAAAMAAQEGWAMMVYEPYKQVFMNICVDGDAKGVPVGAIPLLVMDMWSHSFFKDFSIDKKSYLIAMMKEINWDVVEARMILAIKSDIEALYAIKSVYNGEPEKLLGTATGEEPPPENVPVSDGAPTTPPSPTGGPEQNAYNYAKKGVGY
jgi:Fe-Mn family superoxide dismutase